MTLILDASSIRLLQSWAKLYKLNPAELTMKNREAAPSGRSPTLRKLFLQDTDTDHFPTSAQDRLADMWQLAVDAWAFKGEPVVEQRLPRHIVTISYPGR
jgi:hypothetical protein